MSVDDMLMMESSEQVSRPTLSPDRRFSPFLETSSTSMQPSSSWEAMLASSGIQMEHTSAKTERSDFSYSPTYIVPALKYDSNSPGKAVYVSSKFTDSHPEVRSVNTSSMILSSSPPLKLSGHSPGPRDDAKELFFEDNLIETGTPTPTQVSGDLSSKTPSNEWETTTDLSKNQSSPYGTPLWTTLGAETESFPPFVDDESSEVGSTHLDTPVRYGYHHPNAGTSLIRPHAELVKALPELPFQSRCRYSNSSDSSDAGTFLDLPDPPLSPTDLPPPRPPRPATPNLPPAPVTPVKQGPPFKRIRKFRYENSLRGRLMGLLHAQYLYAHDETPDYTVVTTPVAERMTVQAQAQAQAQVSAEQTQRKLGSKMQEASVKCFMGNGVDAAADGLENDEKTAYRGFSLSRRDSDYASTPKRRKWKCLMQ